MPILRVVWGQSMESSLFFFGEVAHRYRQRWGRQRMLAEPIYDSEGKLASLGRHYDPDGILPPKILVPVDYRWSIGIDRWFIELAQPLDPEEWERTRYVQQGLERVDQWGPLPEGSVDYSELLMVARHDDACCQAATLSGRARCYGQYRAPDMGDVEWVRAQYATNRYRRPNQYGFFDQVDSSLVAWQYESDTKEQVRQEQREIQSQAHDMVQEMRPMDKRFEALMKRRPQAEWTGPDAMKYHCLGVRTLTGRDNQARRSNSGK